MHASSCSLEAALCAVAKTLCCAHSWVAWKAIRPNGCPDFAKPAAVLPPARDFAGPVAIASPGGATASDPKTDPAAQPSAAPAAGRRGTRAALLDLGATELNRRARLPSVSSHSSQRTARRGCYTLAAAELLEGRACQQHAGVAGTLECGWLELGGSLWLPS